MSGVPAAGSTNIGDNIGPNKDDGTPDDDGSPRHDPGTRSYKVFGDDLVYQGQVLIVWGVRRPRDLLQRPTPTTRRRYGEQANATTNRQRGNPCLTPGYK